VNVSEDRIGQGKVTQRKHDTFLLSIVYFVCVCVHVILLLFVVASLVEEGSIYCVCLCDTGWHGGKAGTERKLGIKNLGQWVNIYIYIYIYIYVLIGVLWV